jgi:very-short-patch-repair endonuclease
VETRLSKEMVEQSSDGKFKLKYDWSDLRHLYIDLQYSSNDIARLKGCTVFGVCRALKRYDVPVRKRTDVTLRMREKRIMIGKRNNASKEFYAKKFGYDGLMNQGVLVDLYVVQRLSLKQIAEKFGCGYSTVKKRLLKNGIAVRNNSQARINIVATHPDYVENQKKILTRERINLISHVKDTSIEVKIQDYLKDLKIDFFTHQYVNQIEHSYQCDIFVPAMDLVIECDGNYWHKYPVGNEIDHIRTSELIAKGFKVLRLWESEIKNLSLSDFQNKLNSIKRG